ncbi:hypothetical protein [Pseudoroseomonas ludipueritiae]|uniref:Uncharacterized protein n=1 Tax=Pseudoroseomonas ludipueritiae TaxID=198093 RepID=A0ABR7R4R4_9PROT|nr:hypothetical protein [Pseudoroseomonas ludipueritiae]MBC9176669.1 hypothetical protein [Pseudoroseomonas ludipueritiae]MCG7360789.1 hypothetical protein [Roseomonas sp. ACRSG]
MNKTWSFLGALALILPAGLAQAQTLTITGTGESFAVDYGSGHDSNILGGGAVQLQGGGQDGRIVYQDATFVQRRAGIAMDPGGEGQLVYLPPVPTSTMMSAR